MEGIFALIPFVIMIAIAAFVIVLVNRFVVAVEKIAASLESREIRQSTE